MANEVYATFVYLRKRSTTHGDSSSALTGRVTYYLLETITCHLRSKSRVSSNTSILQRFTVGALSPDTAGTKHVPRVTLRGCDWRYARHRCGEVRPAVIIPAGIFTKRIGPADNIRLLLPTPHVREQGRVQ